MPTDPTNLAWWFPRVRDAGLPVPETVLVHTDADLFLLLDGRMPDGFDTLVAELRAAAERVGTPAFLRSGHTSGKHGWRDTCWLPDASEETVGRHVGGIVEYSMLAAFPFPLPVNDWAVRELIPTSPLFCCTRYGDMPVVPEWRLFVDGGEVTHVQPYWPLEALEQGQPDAPDWRDLVRAKEADWDKEAVQAALRAMAVRAAEACAGGHWSIDFLYSAPAMTWYLTDMAEGDKSFRYDP